MRYALITVVLFLSGCSGLSWLVPDRIVTGVTQYDYLGGSYSPGSSPGGHILESDTGYAYNINFEYDIGPQPERSELDYLREEAMYDRVRVKEEKMYERIATKFAALMPKPVGTVIHTGGSQKDPKKKEDEIIHPHDTLGILEWYGDASLLIQLVIAGLILAVLITLVMFRRSIVDMLKYAAFWRSKEAPKNGGDKGKKKESKDTS